MAEKSKSEKTPLQFRQGDIFFEQISEVPAGFRYDPARPPDRIVLAEGEVTGHFHEIVDDATETVLLSPEDQSAVDDLILHIRTPEGAVVTHPEHAPITLPPGLWKVGRQREYEHGSITKDEQERARKVAD
jgi:hypothetical protein